MSIKVEGIEQLEQKLDILASKRNIAKGLEKACAVVEASAKAKAPKDTGALRRSISSKVDGVEGVVFTPLDYAPYVEFGTGIHAEKGGRQNVPWAYKDAKGDWYLTKGMRSQPFLRPALKENRDKIVRLMKGAIIND